MIIGQAKIKLAQHIKSKTNNFSQTKLITKRTNATETSRAGRETTK